MASVDIADRVAAEIAAWLDTRAQQISDAVLESVYRPQVVEPTTAARVAFFRGLLVNPDGTLNEAGKQRVIQQYGALGYRDVARSVARAVRDEKDAILAEVTDADEVASG